MSKATTIGTAAIQEFMDVHGITGTVEILDELTQVSSDYNFSKSFANVANQSIVDLQLLLISIIKEYVNQKENSKN